jgi:hypothetical protein
MVGMSEHIEGQGHSAPQRGPHNRERIASLNHGGRWGVTPAPSSIPVGFRVVHRQNYPSRGWLLWNR